MTLILLITIGLIILFIAFLVLKSNYKSNTNRLFSLFIISFIVWLFSNYFSNNLDDRGLVLLTNQLIFASTTWLAFFLGLFITTYPNSRVEFRKFFLILGLLGSSIISILSFTDFIVRDIVIQEGFSDIVFGNGIYVYAFHFLSFLIYSIYALVTKFRRSRGIERLKIQYLLLGIGLTAVSTILTNLIFPIVFNNFAFSDIGGIFSIFFVGLTAYSIIRHRMFGLRLFLGTIASVLIVSVFTFIAFYLVFSIESSIFESLFVFDSIALNLFIAVIFTFIVIQLYQGVSGLIRRSYIHSDYDPSVEIEKFNNNLSEKLSLKDVYQEIDTEIRSVMKTSNIELFVENGENYYCVRLEKTSKPCTIEKRRVKSLFKQMGYISIPHEELASLYYSGKATKTQKFFFQFTKDKNISAIIPLFDEEGINGIIALGKRGLPYDEIDLNFLMSVGKSSNLALGRAKYFKKFEDLIEQLEAKVKERTQQLQDLAEEQKDIIDVMGHEIRTPLTAIVQEVKLHKKYTLPKEDKLLESVKGNEELARLLPLLFDTLKTTDRASTHAVALVTDMLETARLDKNRFELNYEKFNIVTVIQESVDLMRKTVDVNGHMKYDIIFEKPEKEISEVEADRTRIGQAIFALLNNAIKYHDPEKKEVKIQVMLKIIGEDIEISFKDNGIGIAQEDIHKLGKKFLRLNPNLSSNLKRPGGTGLGLFVVKGVMQHHGGDLIIDSEGLHKGSTFTLKFPIKKKGK